MKKYIYYSNNPDGFTVVEILVTTVITALFLGLLFQAYMTMEYQRINVARQAKASDIALSNLKKFTVRPSGAMTITCDPSMDLVASASAPGKLIGNESLTTYGFNPEPTDSMKRLGKDAKQTVTAFAPQGCAIFDSSPIKITSTVTFGDQGDKVVHVGYIK